MGGVETSRDYLPDGVRIGKDYGNRRRATMTTEEDGEGRVYVSVTSENVSAQSVVQDFLRAVGGRFVPEGVRR